MKYNDNYILRGITITAWLHDVNDHKYNDTLLMKNKMKQFINNDLLLDNTETNLILNIIDRISYSKENKIRQSNGMLDWYKVLGNKGCIIRDIVSDADKLEAIGMSSEANFAEVCDLDL
jgi:hypothetical protein